MKLLKIALILVLSTNALNANTTSKTETSSVTCDDVLNACGKALTDASAENAILRDLSRTKSEEIDRLRKAEDSASTARWIWFGVGVLAGGAGALYLTK